MTLLAVDGSGSGAIRGSKEIKQFFVGLWGKGGEGEETRFSKLSSDRSCFFQLSCPAPQTRPAGAWNLSALRKGRKCSDL